MRAGLNDDCDSHGSPAVLLRNAGVVKLARRSSGPRPCSFGTRALHRRRDSAEEDLEAMVMIPAVAVAVVVPLPASCRRHCRTCAKSYRGVPPCGGRRGLQGARVVAVHGAGKRPRRYSAFNAGANAAAAESRYGNAAGRARSHSKRSDGSGESGGAWSGQLVGWRQSTLACDRRRGR